MFCPNCSKLTFLHTNKHCIRCHGHVSNNISVLCEQCSRTEKQCSACLKKVIGQNSRANRGCNCGK